MAATGDEEQEPQEVPTLLDGGQQGQAYDEVDSSHALDNTTSLPPLLQLQDEDKMVEHGIVPSTKVASMDDAIDRKSTRLNSSHSGESRMPSSA